MTASEIYSLLTAGGTPEVEAIRGLAREAADDRAGTQALFRDLIEPLSDSFDSTAAAQYAVVFSEIIRELGFEPRLPKPLTGGAPKSNVSKVFVLSRITLGADIAITSVLMNAARHAYPEAQIVFVGPRKNAELWAADPRVSSVEAPYDRTGTLRGRIEAHRALIPLLAQPDAIVIDPDSRLTQLGLLPVCPPERYSFFNSRTFGADTSLALSRLAEQWCRLEFTGDDELIAHSSIIRPYLAIRPASDEPRVTVSLGTGENPAKRVSEAFEIFVLQELVRRGVQVLVDTGAGGEEEARVQLAVDQTSGLPGQVKMFRGSFAEFASHIANSPLYLGYDSAGQHAAAALGIPTVTVFSGYPNERFVQRWRPTGSGHVMARSDFGPDPYNIVLRGSDPNLFENVRAAIHSALP